jgi:membrane protein DedA with SNARE-associated domain
MDRLVDFLLNFSGPTPYVMVFAILLACGLGLPIPEDITLFAAGLASYYGLTNVGVMIAVAFLGVVLGDSLIFWLGATYGRKLTKKWFFHKLLPDERLNRVRSRFNKEGNKLVFFGRFTPGFRAPVFFSAGVLHVPYKEFLFYDGGAALVSVPLIIGAVYFFGDQLDKVVRVIQHVEHGLLFVVAVVFLAILGKWYITHRRLRRT